MGGRRTCRTVIATILGEREGAPERAHDESEQQEMGHGGALAHEASMLNPPVA